MTDEALLLGAVAYDPKVVTIWEGFARWFAARGLELEAVLYSNYERQVEALLSGHVHVAWNSPLAWIETRRLAAAAGRRAEALAMRDTDCDLTSVVVVRSDSPIRRLEDLRGRTVAVGASDSPQATLIPLLHLAEAGLEPERDFRLLRFELLVGKHGDHIGGEREAARALVEGRADAACMIDANHLAFGRDGTLPAGSSRVLAQTPEYDHCNFTVLDDAPRERIERFRELLLSMSYDDPQARPFMELEGVREWRPARLEKYGLLERAVDRFDLLPRLLARAGRPLA
jgi:ABC-type phosphate/phosphonate transport system substrate-binding protein